MFEIFGYVRNDGECPYQDWFNSLNHQAAARVQTTIERMEDGNFGDHKSVGGGVMERRLDFGPGYRIYYGRDGDKLVILLGGGTKKRQNKDVKTALEVWEEYKVTKKEK
jgi:putative addiction module killer protein